MVTTGMKTVNGIGDTTFKVDTGGWMELKGKGHQVLWLHNILCFLNSSNLEGHWSMEVKGYVLLNKTINSI